MGLDSVELIMDVEKYFNIQIPDREAEEITTVQKMVDCVVKHLSITDNSTKLRIDIVDKIQAALLRLGLTDKPLNPSDPVFLILNPHDEAKWTGFCNELNLNIPKPSTKKNGPATSFFDKLLNKVTWDPLYDRDKITVEQFADVICADNCSVLINKENITTSYEVYIAVIRIVTDKAGVEEYEVTPEKSFTNDLGID